MFRAIAICLFSFLLIACNDNDTAASSETTQAITSATLMYVKNHTAVPTDKVKITAIIRSGEFARVRIEPTEPLTDAAFVFLKHSQRGWDVISLGTAFDQTLYTQNNIPKELQLNLSNDAS